MPGVCSLKMEGDVDSWFGFISLRIICQKHFVARIHAELCICTYASTKNCTRAWNYRNSQLHWKAHRRMRLTLAALPLHTLNPKKIPTRHFWACGSHWPLPVIHIGAPQTRWNLSDLLGKNLWVWSTNQSSLPKAVESGFKTYLLLSC